MSRRLKIALMSAAVVAAFLSRFASAVYREVAVEGRTFSQAIDNAVEILALLVGFSVIVVVIGMLLGHGESRKDDETSKQPEA